MKNRLCFLLVLCTLFQEGVYSQSTDSLKQAVSLLHDFHHFDKQFKNNWHIVGLEYKHKLPKSTLLGRINYGSRFGNNGIQAEAEAYPHFSKGLYGYASIGYSPNMPVFPKWRSGASLFYSFAPSWEAEGGLRYLYFDRGLLIGTAGISKYAGYWLLNLRSFVSFDAPQESQSYFFTARRYFKNEKDYLWLRLGSGVSPDESRNVQFATARPLSSIRTGAGIKASFNKRNQLHFSLGWSRDEYLKNTYGNQFISSAGITHAF